MDRISSDRRSELMKRVKRGSTAPEIALRKELHHRGLRYVIGDGRLPGSPDLAFPRFRTVIFVHGCFWHGHSCRKGRLPTTNVDFWAAKMRDNQARDKRKNVALRALGWHPITVWECQLIGQRRAAFFEKLCSRVRNGPRVLA